MARFASVYPLVAARALAREFTYEVPDEVEPGAVVEVRFGRGRQRGVVTEVDVVPPPGIDAAPVERVVEEVPPALVAPLQRKRRGERSHPVARDALRGEPPPAVLSDSQQRALERIVTAIDAGSGSNVLLYGATGSGKTEVYLRACAAALERGLGAIVLVPEIALTPQTVGRFVARFGDGIALLHSALTEAERRDERERIASGEARFAATVRAS